MTGRLRPWPMAVATLVAAGVVLRVVVLAGPSGTIDSDEAVVGLMARGILDGHWRAFYWGQHYAGTIEPALVALAGASVAALKLVPVVLSAVTALLTWRVARRLLDARVAQVAGLLVWIAPGNFVWWSTKERGFYWSSIVLGLLVVLAAQRIVERRSPVIDGLVFGLSAGAGFWTSPASLYFVVPAGLWVVARRHPPLRWLGSAVPAAALGALPWLWHNVGHGFPSLDRPLQPEHVSYVGGLRQLLWRALPMLLNLRYPISERWLVRGVAPLAYLALGGVLAVVLWRRSSRPVLALVGLGTFPFIYAWFPGAWFVGEGRYAVFAVPFLAIVAAWLVTRPSLGLMVCAASAVLSFVVFHPITTVFRPIGSETPRYLAGDLAALRRAGVDTVWADYWVSYRLAFSSGGWLVSSSAPASREPTVYAVVAADPTPALLFPRDDARVALVDGALTQPHRLLRTPHFDVILVTGVVDPVLAP